MLRRGSAGNRWFKVNLHVHAAGNSPEEIVRYAREAKIDLLAITDHQTFKNCTSVAEAAEKPGRPLTILPGIEITSQEGVHLLATFPTRYDETQRSHLIGWLEIPGTGDTKAASRRTVDEILEKIDEECGVVVVPHAFTDDIGLIGAASKPSTKERWLESRNVHLMQVSERARSKITYKARDTDGN